MAKKTVMGLSGGMDSTTLLGILLNEGHEVHCCIFNYGSTHNKYENAAALDVVSYYQYQINFKGKVHQQFIDISPVMEGFSSHLLAACEQEIPEGHYNDENMRKTVVPGRNLIFAAIMAGLAESIGAEAIALGIHQGDHYIYPDCRKEFAKALDTAVYLSSDRRVDVLTPLIMDDKESILRKGYALRPPIPYHLTRTCYKDQIASCGKCGSCGERREAFERINAVDPIKYQEEE